MYKVITQRFLMDEGACGRTDQDMWRRLNRGFIRSLVNIKDGRWLSYSSPAPAAVRRQRYMLTLSALKTSIWSKRVEKLRVPAVFCDLDVCFLGDVGEVFERDFDVAITMDEGILNAGVMFVKPTEGARKLFRRWSEHTNELCRVPAEKGDPFKLAAARERTGQVGVNQPALIDLLNSGYLEGVKVLRLPAAEYNCCKGVWKKYSKETKVVHVHFELREALLRSGTGAPEEQNPVKQKTGLHGTRKRGSTGQAVSCPYKLRDIINDIGSYYEMV